MLIKGFSLIIFMSGLCVFTVKKDRIPGSQLLLSVFIMAFMAILMWFTLLGRTEASAPNSFVPFASFYKITQVRWHGNGEYIFRAIIGNTMLFIPVGIIIANIRRIKCHFVLSGILGFIISISVELIQYHYRVGVLEIDDVISNTWGTVIGCAIGLFILAHGKSSIDARLRILSPLFAFIGIITFVCITPINKEIVRLIRF